MKTASRIKIAATVASVVRASNRPGAPSIPERVQAVPRLVRSTIDGTYAGTTLKRLGLVAGAVAYVASPVDLLPEMILPVLGAADDAVVISWAIKTFLEETDRFIAWETGQGLHRQRPRREARDWAGSGGAASGGGASGAAHTIVPGRPVGSAEDASAPAWAAGVDDGLRRDRDTTGAAAPGRLVAQVTRMASARSRGGAGATGGARTGAATGDRVPLPEGVRQAATDYVLETVRKRLER